MRRGIATAGLVVLLLALAASAGCYRGGGATGACEVACSDDRQCPSGLVCGPAGRCVGDRADDCGGGAGVDGATTDGRPDGAACAGHDEDLDLLVDVCDPCPGSVVNEDPDSDGVGGPCDREPGRLNRTLLFDGLAGAVEYQASPSSAWVRNLANHSVTGGDSIGQAHLSWPVPALAEGVMIQAQIRVLSKAGPGAWIGIGRGGPGLAGARVCRIELQTTDPVGYVTDLPDVDLVTAAAGPLAREATYIITYWEDAADHVRCDFGDHQVMTNVRQLPATDGAVGVVIDRGLIEVDWILVVGRR